MKEVQNFAAHLISNVERVIFGKRDTVELTAICLLCQGHLLIEEHNRSSVDDGYGSP